MISLKQKKLVDLIEGIRSMLDQEDAEACLGAATIERLWQMEKLARAWLQDESTMTEDEWAAALAKLTASLAPGMPPLDGPDVTLH